jgi:uncharacterized protein with HEPN domain
MSISNRDAASLWDMAKAIGELQEFTAGLTYDDYADNLMVQRAVERNLEILGEAARRVSANFQQAHPELDWSGLIGLRNVLAHRYDQIRIDRVWDILVSNLPNILRQLQQFLDEI